MFGGEVVWTDFESCEANGMQRRLTRNEAMRRHVPNDGPVRMFNGFTFLSELDMLELRLAELNGVVDYFILVEELWTFSGKPKPLHYELNKKRFAKYNDRIIHVVLNNSDSSDAWARQAAARGAVVEGLDRVGAKPHDLVFLGDIDEIPNAKHLSLLKHCRGYTLPVSFHMPEYFYDFGCQDEHSHWTRVKLISREHLQQDCFHPRKGVVCPEVTRENNPSVLEELLHPDGFANGHPTPLRLRNSGWHLSYFMSFAKIVEKVGAYAHTERDTQKNHDPQYLQCLVKQCIHINQYSHGKRVSPARDQTPVQAQKWFSAGKKPWDTFYPEPRDVPKGAGC